MGEGSSIVDRARPDKVEVDIFDKLPGKLEISENNLSHMLHWVTTEDMSKTDNLYVLERDTGNLEVFLREDSMVQDTRITIYYNGPCHLISAPLLRWVDTTLH